MQRKARILKKDGRRERWYGRESDGFSRSVERLA